MSSFDHIITSPSSSFKAPSDLCTYLSMLVLGCSASSTAKDDEASIELISRLEKCFVGERFSLISVDDMTFHPQITYRTEIVADMFFFCRECGFSELVFYHSVLLCDQFLTSLSRQYKCASIEEDVKVNPNLLAPACIVLAFTRFGLGSPPEARHPLVLKIDVAYGISEGRIQQLEKKIRKHAAVLPVVTVATYIDAFRKFDTLNTEVYDTAMCIANISTQSENILDYPASIIAAAALDLGACVVFCYPCASVLSDEFSVLTSPEIFSLHNKRRSEDFSSCKEIMRLNIFLYDEYDLTKAMLDINVKLHHYWSTRRDREHEKIKFLYADDAELATMERDMGRQWNSEGDREAA